MLGGFAIAAALSKHYIAKAMATWVLLRVGQKPSHVLLASMFVAMFASMWISNVAAPALCFSLLQPILRTLETGDATSRALVLGTDFQSSSRSDASAQNVAAAVIPCMCHSLTTPVSLHSSGVELSKSSVIDDPL